MAHVSLNPNLTAYTGGQAAFELDVPDIRGLFRELGRRFPELAPHLEDGIAVAINGEIFQETWFEPIPPDAEVHLIPQIAGG